MILSVVILSSLLLTPGAEPTPKYVLKSADNQRIEAVLTYEIMMPKLIAQEWIIYVAKAPELPGQTHVSTTLEPEGKASFELSPERRPVMMAKVSGQNGRKNELTIRVKYQATLRARELVAMKPGRTAPTVEPLSEPTRQGALELGGDFDWKAEPIQKWVRDHRLHRNKDESDIDFARRVFLTIKKNFTYEYKSEMNRHASAVCKAGKSDCGGLSQLLVTILRGNDIPARTLEGRWAQSSKLKELVGELPYYQTHVKAEFFASGVGWVPVDIATAILDKKGDGLNSFGHDPGDFLILHVNPNMRLDSIHFGKQVIDSLQGPAYWVTGRGNVEPTETHEKWEVRRIP
jgi:Transglutaminase-like superfamily